MYKLENNFVKILSVRVLNFLVYFFNKLFYYFINIVNNKKLNLVNIILMGF